MFFTHPVFLCISVFAAALYYLLLHGKKGLRMLFSMLMILLALALLNPLLNTEGNTVLFTFFGRRPFTLEALYYGLMTGGMFVSVLLWFACYNRVMSSDKFIYLFGKCIPAISLLLSMVLRLVPSFQTKAAAIIAARKCVGKAPYGGRKKETLQHSMDVLSVLTSWALEGAVITADSMRSRGYGSGKRSNYSIYRITKADRIAGAIMLLGIVLTIICVVLGGASMPCFPLLVPPKSSGLTVLGCLGYGMFLLLPSILHVWEDATWHILRSKI